MVILASAGISCQTARQLYLFALRQTVDVTFVKGTLDWWICPPDSLAHWLNAGMPDFRRKEICMRLGSVCWERFDIFFWNDFYTIPEQDQSSYVDMDLCFDRERSKFAYLRDKFSSINPETTLFFILNTQSNLDTTVFKAFEEDRYHFTEDNLQSLADSFTYFFKVPIKLYCVTRSDRATESLLNKDGVSIIDSDQSEWFGDDNAWDEIIKQHIPEIKQEQPSTVDY